MYDVLIIGAGQIGSRHLQGIKKANSKLNIDIFDINRASLNLAKERYQKISDYSFEHNLNFHLSYKKIKNKYDIVINATTSDTRYITIENFFENSNTKHMIMEKILFNDPKEYKKVNKIFKKNGCTSWVNCPRRMWKSYQSVYDKLLNEVFYFSISGPNINLMSNIIHFIDLVSFITKSKNYKLDLNYLEPKLLDSKRLHYKEMMGNIILKFQNGTMGNIHDYSGSNITPSLIQFYNDNHSIIINERYQKKYIFSKGNWKKYDFIVPYQSNLSHHFINNLLENNMCNLTPYDESMELHLEFVTSMLKYLNKTFAKSYEKIPFT